MSLQTQLNSFVLRVAEEFNTVKGRTGNYLEVVCTSAAASLADTSEISLVVYR